MPPYLHDVLIQRQGCRVEDKGFDIREGREVYVRPQPSDRLITNSCTALPWSQLLQFGLLL